jgi:hypothetical protein
MKYLPIILSGLPFVLSLSKDNSPLELHFDKFSANGPDLNGVDV